MLKFFRRIQQNTLSKNRFSNYLIYALGEVFLIAIGIFMALQLQNWNEAKKTKEATYETLKRIKKEITTNKKQIDNAYKYHIMVKDTINKIQMPKTEQEALKSLEFWKGLRVNRLQDAAFQTAIQSGVSKDINIDLLEHLNNLYTIQGAYNDFAKTASQGLYSIDFSDVSSFKRLAIFISMTMSDLYYFETDLKEKFSTNLKEIDAIIN